MQKSVILTQVEHKGKKVKALYFGDNAYSLYPEGCEDKMNEAINELESIGYEVLNYIN